MIDIVNAVLDCLPKISSLESNEANEFQDQYRREVARKLDVIEIFGMKVDTITRRYNLSASYIDLDVRNKDGSIEIESSSIDRLSIEKMLKLGGRFFIEGSAGTGKTTALQWIALQCARRGFSDELSDWNNLTPFFIRLRRTLSGLPRPEQFIDQIASNLVELMPKGWIHKRLVSGHAVVLIDGLDEVRQDRRQHIFDWLSDLLEGEFRQTRYIVTSRPGVVVSDFFRSHDFFSAEIVPMSVVNSMKFVDRWRSSISRDSRAAEYEENISQACYTIKRAIEEERNIRELSSYPLICSLLCYMCLESRGLLPSSKMMIYEEAISMFWRRDVERKIYKPGPAFLDKFAIVRDFLQQIAYWLSRNEMTEIHFDDLIPFVASQIPYIEGKEAESKEVIAYLLERSGVLREPAPQHVDFIHKSLQEYLAARCAILHFNDVGALVAHAGSVAWNDTIVFAAGHALPTQIEKLLIELMDKAEEAQEKRLVDLSRSVYLLVLLCEANAVRIAPRVRKQLTKVASRILPPRSAAEAQALANYGQETIDLLEPYTDNNYDDRRYCIRTLRLLGGNKSMKLIERFIEKQDSSTAEEALNAWEWFDLDEYGKHVIEKIAMPLRLIFRSWDALVIEGDARSLRCEIYAGTKGAAKYGKYILSAISVDLSQSVDCSDFSFIENLEKLEILNLHECWNLRNLEFLSNLRQLKYIDIQDCENFENVDAIYKLPKACTLLASDYHQFSIETKKAACQIIFSDYSGG